MSRRPGGFLRLHGGLELGALPGPAGGLALAGGLLWPRLRLELHAGALVPRTGAAALGEVRVGLYTAAVHACARVGRGALELPLCLGLEGGAMRGAARGVPGARGATAGWLAAVVGPGVAWRPAPRVALWAALQLVLAPVRPVFEAGEADAAVALHDPGVASGRLLLGVELRLRDPWPAAPPR